jgi:hypothetical protein
MKRLAIGLGLILIALQGFGCPTQENACASAGEMTFICGPQNAEDLVLIPETPWVLSSAMGEAGGIYLIDSRDKGWRAIYSEEPNHVRHDSKTYGACARPPSAENFITHGLHIRTGEAGHSTLYVVGHGGREAIEVFDVDATQAEPALVWIGCIPMPEGLAANSVASFSDGSLVATVLMHPGDELADMFAGKPTGAIYEWSPGDPGFSLIEGTALPGNNGIEVSSDENEIFVASSGLRTVVAYSRSNPARKLRSTRVLDFVPDNLHFARDGSLLTAGTNSEQEGCIELGTKGATLEQFASCPRGFVAARIDTDTMADHPIVRSDVVSSFSNATMVLEVGDEAWIGTFSGDRIGVASQKSRE